MGLVERFLREGHCPMDGSRLHGPQAVCLVCRSTWRGLLEGDMTTASQPLDARDFLRRKLDDIANHRLTPERMARATSGGSIHPQALAVMRENGIMPQAVQTRYGSRGGTGLTGGRLATMGETIQWQAQQHLRRRVVDGGARLEVPMLKNVPMPGSGR